MALPALLRNSALYVRLRPWLFLAYGTSTFLPFVPNNLLWRATGGTVSARYCYAVWMRHLVRLAECGLVGVPPHVAELGPGDSLGTGVAALLTGAARYTALDVVAHGDLTRTINLVDEIAELVARKTPIPGPDEFPDVYPRLRDYDFPSALLGESALQAALVPARVAAIKRSLLEPGHVGALIRYAVPWDRMGVAGEGLIDLLFSQAVMEHVADISAAYPAMGRLLREGGWCSHSIDFRSHGITESWDGHRAYSRPRWSLLHGRRPYLINREPCSAHIESMRRQGFQFLVEERECQEPTVSRQALAPKFSGISEADRRTSGVYLAARRSFNPDAAVLPHTAA